MSIEFVAVQDIPELLDLVHSAYRGEGSKKGWTTEADLLDGTRTSAEILEGQVNSTTSVLLKYIEDDKILGCVSLEKTKKKGALKCYVGLLTVSPDQQAKGIGKQLLRASEVWAKGQGCEALTMTVISARVELIAWYKRYGFIDTGDKAPFNSEPVFGIPKQHLEFIIMDKKL